MQDIYVVGVGMTLFGRHLDKTIKQLTAAAVKDALEDAGCARERIGAAFFGNTVQGFMGGQQFIRGQVALAPLGLQGIPVFNLENACATGSSAFNLAVNYLRAESTDVAIAVASEKMYSTDKAKMFSVFDSGWDIDTPEENERTLLAMGQGVEVPAGTTSTKPYSRFMDIYAAYGRQLMRNSGVTQRQIAIVAAKNHAHAVHNERAQYRQAMTPEEVLAAPPITYPLTLPMCAPVSDGAAAVILCTGEALARHGFNRQRAVKVLASVMRSATTRDADDLDKHVTRLAALCAYELAGVGPRDIDVIECHDATAIGELVQMEALGICKQGECGALAESGATTIGGRVPVNPSGGLESKGHPIAATGLGQIFELVQQLRGECGPRQVEGARLALHENGGGLWGVEEAAAHVGIFARGQVISR